MELQDDVMLVQLLRLAERRGWIAACAADQLHFFAAAEHALRFPAKNAGGLFTSTVRQRRWHVITQADENAARLRMQRVRLARRAGHATENADGNVGLLVTAISAQLAVRTRLGSGHGSVCRERAA